MKYVIKKLMMKEIKIPPLYLLNKLMLYTTTPNVLAMTYGQENEKRAWTLYKILSLLEHQNFVI